MSDIIPITPAAKEKKESLGQGGMIVPFWGEFLISPSPLEWSLNYCSHACSYCFANLNSPTRKGDAMRALRQAAEIGQRTTLTDLYLRNKYPVCIANKSDAFSESNYRETMPVIEALKEHGVPIQFQTKGGLGIDEALDGLPPSVWYITISQWDDALRKRIEPGAPSIPERLELIERLTGEGHHVVVGVNPAVSEWIPDPEPMMRALAELGVYGVWMERLHLHEKQMMFISDYAQRAMTKPVIDRALIRKGAADADIDYLELCHSLAREAGLEPYTYTHYKPTDFFGAWRDVYPNTLPIIQDFANECHMRWPAQGEDDYSQHIVTFEDYIDCLEGTATPFFKGRQRIGDYMRVVSYRTVEKIKGWTDWMTYRQLLWLAWENPGNKLSPASHSNFALAIDAEDNILTDGKGVPYYLFVPGGVNGHYLLYEGDELDG